MQKSKNYGKYKKSKLENIKNNHKNEKIGKENRENYKEPNKKIIGNQKNVFKQLHKFSMNYKKTIKSTNI